MDRDGAPQRRILSKAAQGIIQAALESGKYNEDRQKALEPPYMTPSTDPMKYSAVCPPPYSTSFGSSPTVVFVVLRSRQHPRAVLYMQSRDLHQVP